MTASPAFRILVVDENPAVRLFVELAVGSDVMRVEGAANSHAAANAIDRTPPNLVLAAAGMTGLGAHDLAAQLSRHNVPMVLMKGSLDQSTLNHREAAGVLAKPLNLEQLRNLVARIAADEPSEFAAPTTPFVVASEPAVAAIVEFDDIDAWMSGADSALGFVPPRWRRLAAEGEVLHSFAHDLAAFRAGGATGYLKISSKTSITTPRRVATTRSPTM
jgi:CheY-like chemotaxis protein